MTRHCDDPNCAVDELEREEAEANANGTPPAWWWLSFVDLDSPAKDKFVGGCLVYANSMMAAVKRSHVLGINPGGQVAGFGPMHTVNDDHPREVLMSRAEINRYEQTHS